MAAPGTIRLVEEFDVDPMLNIYGPVVENTATSFEYRVPSHEEFWTRIINNLETRPWLVCEIGNMVAGYAYASQHRVRSGYDWCSEVSVYVNPRFQRRRVGKALYISLLEVLGLLGCRNAYAVITLPNAPSIEFHRAMEFRYLTVYRAIGYKLEKWHDVEWWQFNFPQTGTPSYPLKFGDVKELSQYQKALTMGSKIL